MAAVAAPSVVEPETIEIDGETIEVPENLYGLVKEIFVAPAGEIFFAADFAGIEARLVGWEAQDPGYVRLTGLGVHDFLASYLLHRPAELSWSDADLGAYLAEIKANHKPTREIAKRVIHSGNYLVTGMKLWMEYPKTFSSSKDAQWYLDFYLDLFPAIGRWHKQTLALAEQQGYLRNAYGYKHDFSRVYDYAKVAGAWEKRIGEDAKRVIAFKPQSTAAAIMKQTMRWIRQELPVLDRALRLTIHDELLGLTKLGTERQLLDLLIGVMERPRPELPIPASWGMGTHLRVGADGKIGTVWARMK